MFLMEYFSTEEDILSMIQEEAAKDTEFKDTIIDPIIDVLETSTGKKRYIGCGNTFLEANSEMLAKEYPSKSVTFPRKYVDDIFELFNFNMNDFKNDLKTLIKKYVSDMGNFLTIINNPTNVIHTVVLYYSDMILNRELRDAARQQLGLSVYNNIYNKYYPQACVESIMAYTYMQLDATWGLVRSENVVTWIGDTVDTSYAFWKTKMSLNMSISTVVKFLNRVRDSFNQNMRHLSNKYHENAKENSNLVGNDVSGSDEYMVTSNFNKFRENLMRMIKNKDPLYCTKSDLYYGIAKLKNVKADPLFDFAQKIENKDIEKTIDDILYVFISKDGNSLSDINSTKYISKITNMPTQVDRAIKGQPIILPFIEKYEVTGDIVRAYVCLMATYILKRSNEAQ